MFRPRSNICRLRPYSREQIHSRLISAPGFSISIVFSSSSLLYLCLFYHDSSHIRFRMTVSVSRKKSPGQSVMSCLRDFLFECRTECPVMHSLPSSLVGIFRFCQDFSESFSSSLYGLLSCRRLVY